MATGIKEMKSPYRRLVPFKYSGKIMTIIVVDVVVFRLEISVAEVKVVRRSLVRLFYMKKSEKESAFVKIVVILVNVAG